MWRFICFSCLVMLVYSQTTEVSQCIGQVAPLPVSVYIEGCVTPPCPLPQLQDAVFNITFKAPRAIQNMSTQVRAYLMGLDWIGLNYDLGDDAVTCNFLTNNNCPVMEDEVVQYTLKIYVHPLFPVGLGTNLEIFVQDLTTLESLFCLRVPVNIINPRIEPIDATHSDVHVISIDN